LLGVYQEEFSCINPKRKIIAENVEFPQKSIEQEEQEEFPIIESDAVVQPRTMMIHIKHTSVAGGTMMGSLRLEDMANQTVSSFLVLRLIQEESLIVILKYVITQNRGTFPGSRNTVWRSEMIINPQNKFSNPRKTISPIGSLIIQTFMSHYLERQSIREDT
jgi:hypothetical protein